MDKKADGDICAHLLCFSTVFSEICSISIFFWGRLNGAVKSDLTLPYSAHFAIQTASKKDPYAENFRKIGWKTKKMCANIPIGFFVRCPFETFETFEPFKNIFFFISFVFILECKTEFPMTGEAQCLRSSLSNSTVQ